MGIGGCGATDGRILGDKGMITMTFCSQRIRWDILSQHHDPTTFKRNAFKKDWRTRNRSRSDGCVFGSVSGRSSGEGWGPQSWVRIPLLSNEKVWKTELKEKAKKRSIYRDLLWITYAWWKTVMLPPNKDWWAPRITLERSFIRHWKNIEWVI